MSATQPLYALMAEFDDAEALAEAARRAREAGYRRLDAYSPFPVEGLAEALGMRRTWISWIVLAAGAAGAVAGYALQHWISVLAYPLNVGGRPLLSLPSWVPVTFETTVLFAALAAVAAMVALNGLPQPYHPLFNVPAFGRASRDGFFLAIEAEDPQFDPRATREFLESLGPREVHDVPQ